VNVQDYESGATIFFRETVDKLDLLAKISCQFTLLINLRLKFCDTYQLNIETFPDLVELILDDRQDVRPRHAGSSLSLSARLCCVTAKVKRRW
jgi:hypothetical protein